MLRNAMAGLLLTCGLILLLLLALGFHPRQIRAMFAHPVSGGTATAGRESRP